MTMKCKEKGHSTHVKDVKKIAIASVALAVFFLMLSLVLSGNAALIDDPIRNFFYSIRNDGLTKVVRLITYLGNWQTVVLFCLVLLLYPKTSRTYGLPVSIGAIIVTLLNKTIKKAVARPRPDDIVHLVNEGGFSFPSGHSITSMFIYGLLACLIYCNIKNQNLNAANLGVGDKLSNERDTVVMKIPIATKILIVLLTLLPEAIGLSRIYLGVHYPTDVIAGWSLGIIAILVALSITQKSIHRL